LGSEILGEEAQKNFIRLFGQVLKTKNILNAFDDFDGNEILSPREFQDYQSLYLDFYQAFRPKGETDKENINDDIVFEMELIKQIEVNIDYILMLVAKYHATNSKNKEVLLESIEKAVNSSMELRSKKDLILGFIERVNVNSQIEDDWKSYVVEQKEQDLSQIIAEERLKNEETRHLIEGAFRDGTLKTTGTDMDKIMPPTSRFGGGNRSAKKQTVIDKLLGFFEKYFGMA
jgi:type I restriction enzyme R subunit